MALVKMTDSLINSICTEVEKMYSADMERVPPMPVELPSTIADAIFNWVLPEEAEKAAREALPAWAVCEMSTIDVYLEGKMLRGRLSKPRWSLSGHRYDQIYNVPGVGRVRFSNDDIWLENLNLEAMQNLELKAFIERMAEISRLQSEAKKVRNEERSKMAAFLRQHKSLQSAMAAFGPALWKFVPPSFQEQYQRPVERRKRSASDPVQHEAVDVSSIIAKVTIQHLGIEKAEDGEAEE